jgi:dihydroneopterin aldolase
LLVSVVLSGSLKVVAISDDVSKGIDYGTVTAAIVNLGKTDRKTVERFAEDVASMLLKDFKPESVQVTVSKKPDLPLESASVTITRP